MFKYNINVVIKYVVIKVIIVCFSLAGISMNYADCLEIARSSNACCSNYGNATFHPIVALRLARLAEQTFEALRRASADAPYFSAAGFEFDEESNSIKWRYANSGDYDFDGEVGIPDITPLAINYGRIVDTENPLHVTRWLDGDGNGEVGIPDVVLIALNYEWKTNSYAVFIAGDVPAVELPDELLLAGQFAYVPDKSGDWKAFEFVVPQGVRYVRVVEYGSSDEFRFLIRGSGIYDIAEKRIVPAENIKPQ